ncbi:MAG: hypothetical protein EVB06_00240 [Synechococcus sp. MED-G133]|uniref:hypothetical protein n=1 Tax=Synechococcus sp. A15-28 TaxID=1050638 RepID=UPI00121A3B11|nr:hypothetical protein [Synechococcus sp. A15-28]MBA4732916.1 hypothetical protein [Synechococcus sp.]QNI43011.1 putative conserved secreted protein [Synechococcus sp. A15-28]RZO09814.1 MAG: hypothetical protein EVB06_00240 [Synechococcus sp. MED-G133]
MPLLPAAAATPPPMVCTIETVESRWSPRAIAGVRMLRGQSFTVTRSPDIKLTPRYVIDSRITSLAEETEPPVGSIENQRLRYSWSYIAALGPVAPPATSGEPSRNASISVEGQLRIRADRSFDLVNVSAMTAEGSTTALTTLRDSASGTCREQP